MIDSVSDAVGAAADLKKARRRKNVSASDPINWTGCRRTLWTWSRVFSAASCSRRTNASARCIEKLKGIGVEALYDLRHQTIFRLNCLKCSTHAGSD